LLKKPQNFGIKETDKNFRFLKTKFLEALEPAYFLTLDIALLFKLALRLAQYRLTIKKKIFLLMKITFQSFFPLELSDTKAHASFILSRKTTLSSEIHLT